MDPQGPVNNDGGISTFLSELFYLLEAHNTNYRYHANSQSVLESVIRIMTLYDVIIDTVFVAYKCIE